MKLRKVTLHRLESKMREPFETSFGREEMKNVIIVEVETEAGATGFAECVTSEEPLYSSETNETAWHVLRDFLIPMAKGWEGDSLSDVSSFWRLFSPIRGHQMAKAALEMAVFDAWSNETNIPLHNLLGGVKAEIPVGISVGIQPDVNALLSKIEGYLKEGFQRIKVKIKPGWDVDVIAAIRDEFGDIPLMADANSAYTLADLDYLKRLDAYHLMMIEQPLGYDDIVDHAHLQSKIQTPICLDESIHTPADARKAIQLGSCHIINMKVGRVGGFAQALAIHEICRQESIPLWCGGMLETGVGRLHNIALTALPGFTLPGDTAPSARYFDEDIIDPPVAFSRPGVLTVEDLAGVANRVNRSRMAQWTVQKESF